MDVKPKPLRILQVLGSMNRGGSETMIMELYRNIDRSKIQFDFVVHTTDNCVFDDEINALGGIIHRVPRYTGINHLNYKKSWDNLFYNNPEYKIIHTHIRSTASVFLKIAKANGLVTIAHSHSTSNGSGVAASFKNILQKDILDYSDYLLAASEEAGEWLFGRDALRQDNFFVLNNAIQTEKFIFNNVIREEERKKLNLDSKVAIGHVGNFKREKNHKFIIDVFKAYHELNTKSILILIGEGKLENTIKNKVEEYGLVDSVMFLGSRPDVDKLMQAIDLFIFPSIFEGLGIVVIEAQAAGLPVLASKGIPKETAITDLIQYESIDSSKIWAEKINNMINTFNNRKDMSNHVILSGYDIKDTVYWLERFYLSMG